MITSGTGDLIFFAVLSIIFLVWFIIQGRHYPIKIFKDIQKKLKDFEKQENLELKNNSEMIMVDKQEYNNALDRLEMIEITLGKHLTELIQKQDKQEGMYGKIVPKLLDAESKIGDLKNELREHYKLENVSNKIRFANQQELEKNQKELEEKVELFMSI